MFRQSRLHADLPYPGGPALSQLAKTGNPKAYRFPRPLLKETRIAFSFSGLKTAVRYMIAGPGQKEVTASHLSPGERADIAASLKQLWQTASSEKPFRQSRERGFHAFVWAGESHRIRHFVINWNRRAKATTSNA